MSRKTADPLWTVRGMSRGQDICLVIEAVSATAAECFATKRGIEVVVVNDAEGAEVTDAANAGRLWRYTPQPRLKCFGHPVGQLQTACLVISGLATVVLNLKARGIPLRLHW